MEELFKTVAGSIALGIEGAAVLIVACGAVEAACGAIVDAAKRRSRWGQRREIWLGFAVWLLLGLEFELAADVIRTAISPTWEQIGQLAAIGAIRTFLNYFLERDLDKHDPRPTPELSK